MPDKASQNDELQAIFEQAAGMVSNLPEGLQQTAFEIAVRRLSGETEPAQKPPTQETVRQPVEEDDPLLQDGTSGFFENLKKATGLPVEELKAIYEVDDKGSIQIVAPLPSGRTISEHQRLLTLLLLLGNQVGNKEDWLTGFEVSRVLREHGVMNKHVAKNLKTETGKLKVVGVKRARKYGLTPTGVNYAKKKLKEITGGDDGE